MSDDAVRGRVRAGRLHRVHRGVYAVGHRALSREGWSMAAVLACGRRNGAAGAGDGGDPEATRPLLSHWGAAVSHRSAAELWGLLRARPGAPWDVGSAEAVAPPVDVTVPGRGGSRARRGIRLHRSPTLVAVEVVARDGIPVTRPARTIEDLERSVSRGEGIVSARELRRAVRQAEVLGLPLSPERPRERTRSDLEADFLALCRRFRLPAPEVNVRVGPHRVDFLWRDRRLVVETDGWAYHRGRAAFEDDRARDLDLRARGYEVLRIADRQLDAEPEAIARTLRRLLRRGA